jgi:hypothetical protein
MPVAAGHARAQRGARRKQHSSGSAAGVLPSPIGPDALTQLAAAAVGALMQPRVSIDRNLLATVLADMRGPADPLEGGEQPVDPHRCCLRVSGL